MSFKPPRWNVSPALIAPNARDLWKGLAFIAPLWGHAGKGALLNRLGQPLAGANLVAGAALQWRGTPYGIGAGGPRLSQSSYAPIVTSDGAYTGDFTVVCYANPIAEASASAGVVQMNGLTTYVHLGFNCNSSINTSSGDFRCNTRSGGVNVSAGVTDVIDGKYHMFGGRRKGSVQEAWIDGVMRATVSATPSVIGDGSSSFAFGDMPGQSGRTINTATTIVLAAAWNRSLSNAEMRLLARDPFIMFRPVPEWRGVWTAAGSSIAKAVAWRVIGRAQKASAWRVFARASKASAWSIFTRASKSSAWRVLTRAAKPTAWSILNTLQAAKAVSWRIMGRASKPAAWRIFARNAKATAWRVFTRTGKTSAWRVFTRAVKPASWRILGRRAVSAAWRILARAARAAAWRIGAAPTVDADVHLNATAHGRHMNATAHARTIFARSPKR